MRRLALVLFALVGCTPDDFPVESNVDRLRVLGIASNPADLHPGETAQLSGLVLDPTRPGQATTTFWIGCDPDPFNLNRSVCADPAVINDPSKLGDMSALPAGVKFIGLDGQAAYSAPRGVFDVLASDDPRRVLGTVGQVLAISIAEEISPTAPMDELRALFEKVQRGEVRSLVSLFRIHLSEDPERNHNPVVQTLFVDDEPWPAGARVMLAPDQRVKFDVDAADEAFEPYTASTPNGPEARTERILVAWYSMGGRFSEERTAMREGVKTFYTAPGSKRFDPLPERRTSTMWTVLRDTRGGLSWSEFPLFFCDDTLPAPEVTALRAPAQPGDDVVLEGAQLGSVLDVIVDGVALTRGRANADGTRWTAQAPSTLSPGAHPVVIHTRRCERVGGQTLQVP